MHSSYLRSSSETPRMAFGQLSRSTVGIWISRKALESKGLTRLIYEGKVEGESPRSPDFVLGIALEFFHKFIKEYIIATCKFWCRPPAKEDLLYTSIHYEYENGEPFTQFYPSFRTIRRGGLDVKLNSYPVSVAGISTVS